MAESSRRLGAALVGVGMAVPRQIVSNAQIAQRLGVDEQWISRRTGTKVRHVASQGERLEHLAADAARAALQDAGVDPVEVDLVLVGTTSAEEMSPHAAPLVAADIGTKGAGAIDVSAACPGFLSCLSLGTSMIEAGRARTVVAIGADVLSRYLDPMDRGSAMLFGDGAGAVVLTGIDGPTQVDSVCLHSDGEGRDLIRLDRDERLIRMDGPSVFRYAVRCMTDVTREVLDEVGVSTDDVDLFVYHQANTRIIDAVGKRLHLDPAKVINVIEEYANTSAASLPIALASARSRGQMPDGSRVLLSAFGAGMVWGGAMVTWGRPA